MSTSLKTLIGRRIRFAREERGMTQQDLAEKIRLKDSQTISSIECGIRNVKPEELVLLINEFNKELDFFTNPYLIIGENIVSWRKKQDNFSVESEQKAMNLISLYRRVAELNDKTTSVVLFKTGINRQSNFSEIELLADRINDFLELGKVPADHLIDKIETKLGVPVLFDTIEGVSGAAFNLPDFCGIIINREEVKERRNYDLAHELFHLLTWTELPPHEGDFNDAPGKKPKSEKFADQFASFLLMPQKHIIEQWSKLDGSDIQIKVKSIAKHFHVSSSAAYWRLVNLGVFSKNDVKEPCGSNGYKSQNDKYYNTSFVTNLQKCISLGKISIRQACKLLGCDALHLETVFSQYDLRGIYDN